MLKYSAIQSAFNACYGLLRSPAEEQEEGASLEDSVRLLQTRRPTVGDREVGLRPQEIYSLQDKSMWRIEFLPTGQRVLWTLQTKIIALPPEDRGKPIPILFDNKHIALKAAAHGKAIAFGLYSQPP